MHHHQHRSLPLRRSYPSYLRFQKAYTRHWASAFKRGTGHVYEALVVRFTSRVYEARAVYTRYWMYIQGAGRRYEAPIVCTRNWSYIRGTGRIFEALVVHTRYWMYIRSTDRMYEALAGREAPHVRGGAERMWQLSDSQGQIMALAFR